MRIASWWLGVHNRPMDDGLDRGGTKDLRRLAPALKFLLPYKKQILFASFALVVTACATLLIGQGVRLLIDNGFGGGDGDALNEALSYFISFVVLLTVGTFVRFYFVSWIGERISADIRVAVFSRLLRMHPGFFEVNLPSEIQTRITTDTTLLQTVIGSSVSVALRNILLFFGGMILLIVTSPSLALIAIGGVPIVVIPIVFFGRKVRFLSRQSQDRLADVGTFAGESLRHIKTVQSFSHEEKDEFSFTGHAEEAFLVAVRRIKHRALLIAAVMLLVFGAVGIMIWVGGQNVILGTTSPGQLAAFIFYAVLVAGATGAISEVYSDLQRAAGATERLVELLESPVMISSPAQPRVLSGDHVELEFRKVSFAYETRPEIQVLSEIDFLVGSGEMVAIVGPSGAGKSTIFDLTQRFYDPTSGSVTINGSQIKDFSLQEIRDKMGYVSQDPVLFSGSLKSNLLYVNRRVSEEDLREALELAKVDFVDDLPNGLDTLVGEDGVGLSGGQRQRIAIARALLSKPAILLLDEATSALDAESESKIRSSIEKLKGRMSILVVAHRISTVRQADRILVIDKGRLIGEGSHEQLRSNNILYEKFADIQFVA